MAINGVTIVVSGGQWMQPGQGESEASTGTDRPPLASGAGKGNRACLDWARATRAASSTQEL